MRVMTLGSLPATGLGAVAPVANPVHGPYFDPNYGAASFARSRSLLGLGELTPTTRARLGLVLAFATGCAVGVLAFRPRYR